MKNRTILNENTNISFLNSIRNKTNEKKLTSFLQKIELELVKSLYIWHYAIFEISLSFFNTKIYHYYSELLQYETTSSFSHFKINFIYIFGQLIHQLINHEINVLRKI